MLTHKLDKLIQKGEVAREKEQYKEALNTFNQVIIQAGFAQKYEYVFNALVHRSHLYKHLYQKTNYKVFLILMHADCQAALEIAQSKTSTKLPHAFMELGNYYFLKQNYKQSSKYYLQAIKKLKNKSNVTYAEFLSHWAISEALLGKKQGLVNLKKAQQIISKDKTLRPFHKLVVESGNTMRLILAISKFESKEGTNKLLSKAQAQSETLAQKYKMPMRKIQFQQLLEKLKKR